MPRGRAGGISGDIAIQRDRGQPAEGWRAGCDREEKDALPRPEQRKKEWVTDFRKFQIPSSKLQRNPIPNPKIQAPKTGRRGGFWVGG